MTILQGDVLAVRTSGLAATAIRLGAAIRGKPNLSNHVAVAHHMDVHGTLWCIEGRPGGAGWRDARAYEASRWTLDNSGQPKTDAQRALITTTMEALIGTAYDWEAIAADAAADLSLDTAWLPAWHGTVPGHVVCSSLAAYAYGKAGLACPSGGRQVQPSDWDAFILTRAWLNFPEQP